MRTGKLEVGGWNVKYFLLLTSYFLLLILLSCGRKGDPKVPLNYIPGHLQDLVIAPKEKRVMPSWKMPEKNEDGEIISFLDKGEDLSPPGLSYGKTYGYKEGSRGTDKIKEIK